MKIILLLATHGGALALGFALGIYALPILIAPPDMPAAMLDDGFARARWTVEIRDDLAGSDPLHWGRGTFAVSDTQITHKGTLAPGPDYRLYLSPEFVQDEAGFNAVKARSIEVAPVRRFSGFSTAVPAGTDVSQYKAVVVWCETFGEFITAAAYQ